MMSVRQCWSDDSALSSHTLFILPTVLSEFAVLANAMAGTYEMTTIWQSLGPITASRIAWWQGGAVTTSISVRETRRWRFTHMRSFHAPSHQLHTSQGSFAICHNGRRAQGSRGHVTTRQPTKTARWFIGQSVIFVRSMHHFHPQPLGVRYVHKRSASSVTNA
jgi:hypothetical protein